jgi:chorismate mutase
MMLVCGMPMSADRYSVDRKLAAYRKQIDTIDRQLVDLLEQRAEVVAEVGTLKRGANLPVTVPAREQQVLDHVVQMGSGGALPPEVLRRIYQTLVTEMRMWEQSVSHSPSSPQQP